MFPNDVSCSCLCWRVPTLNLYLQALMHFFALVYSFPLLAQRNDIKNIPSCYVEQYSFLLENLILYNIWDVFICSLFLNMNMYCVIRTENNSYWWIKYSILCSHCILSFPTVASLVIVTCWENYDGLIRHCFTPCKCYVKERNIHREKWINRAVKQKCLCTVHEI